MAAKRFHSKSYDTVSSNTYDVEIWDTLFGGSSTEFECGPDIFTMNYTGETRNTPVWLQPTEVSFQFHVSSATHEALIDDMNAAQEGRFRIKIFKNSNFHWCGNVIIDHTHRPDLATGNYAIEIRATDMIGALKNVDYNDDGTAYTGTDTLLGHIHKCLSKTGLLDFGWGASDVCIRTVDNWYEDSQVTGAANDPLVLSRVRHRAFFDIDNNGTYKYKNCLEVLEMLVQDRYAVLKQSAGSWYFIQYSTQVAAGHTERRYDRDGAYLSSTASADYTKTLDQDSTTAAKENVVDFGWYAPIKKVIIDYHAKNWTNYLAGASWSNTSSVLFSPGLEINHNSNLTTLGVKIQFSGTTTNSGYDVGQPAGQPVPVFVVFRIKIKVGSQYLRRNLLNVSNYQATYSNFYWDTSAGFVYHAAMIQLAADTQTNTFGPIYMDIMPPSLPATGDFEAKVEFENLRAPNNGNVIGTSYYSLTWLAGDGLAQVYSNGVPLTDLADERHVAQNDNAAINSELVELSSLIGDGTTVNSQGKIEVYNGSAWEDAADWQVGGTGTKYKMLSLLANQIAASRKTPVLRMSGDIYDTGGTMEAHSRIDDNSSDAIWLLVQASYNARMERWSGDWFYIADSPTDITTDTPVSIDPTDPTTKVPVTTTPGGIGGTIPTTPGISTGGIISSTSTNGLLSSGAVTSISTSQSLTAGAFVTGQVVTVVNPVSGYQQNFTVTQDTAAGDTSISVSGYAADDFPPGSFIIVSPQNATTQGFGSASTVSSAQSTSQTSNWWTIFQQWFSVDNTNAIDWPIEAPNVVLDTDENAGNGSTAGVRFDGDGLTAYNSSSATPTVKIDKSSGKLLLQNSSHPTPAAGLTYGKAGMLHMTDDAASSNALNSGHAQRFQVIPYTTDWTTGTKGVFWRIGEDFEGYQVYKIKYSLGDSAGSGSGNNTVAVKLYDHSLLGNTVIDSETLDTFPGVITVNATSAILEAEDAIWFDVTAAKSTPGKGLMIDIYLRVPV